MVEIDGKKGFINSEGKEVVEPICQEIGLFGLYKDDWAKVKLNGKYGFIDNEGKFVSQE